MAEFIITAPDGKKYRVTGENKEGALAALKKKLGAGDAPKSGVVEQLGQGTKEGVGSLLGAPVDLATAALNFVPTGINAAVGTEIPTIQNPVGGSQWMRDRLSSAIPDAPAPEGMPQRYARRIGQEVGYGVPASILMARAPGMGPAMDSPGAYLGASAAGDVGAGIAGQTSREIAPNSDTADLISSMLGGAIGAGGASMLMPKRAPTPTLEDVKRRANEAWGDVNASDARLSDQAVQDLSAKVKGALPTSQLGPEAYPKAFSLADKVPDLKNPTISEVEDMRRIIGDAVAGNPQESRVGVNMKKEIADYLSGVKSGDFVSGDGTDVAGDLARARDLTGRVKRAEAVLNKEMRGESRAATTGTGGNEVNAQRQNIRSLLDTERDPTLSAKRKGFKPAEMDQMEKVVFGTGGSNTARALGRMSPTSGALGQVLTGWGGSAGLAAGAATGNPLLALPALAGAVGFGAKASAESMTKRQISDLLATILSGAKPQKSAAKKAAQTAIIEQLISNAVRGVQ